MAAKEMEKSSSITAGAILAIDVGGHFIKYALVDSEDTLSRKGKVPTPTDNLDDFLDVIEGIYAQFFDEVEGVAFSMPGILDPERGFMYTGGSLLYIRHTDMKGEMAKRLPGVKIALENDGKAAAWAEMTSGALKDCRNGVVVICGTGIGGGAFNERQMIRGSNFFAGEYSYIVVGENNVSGLYPVLGYENGIRQLYRNYERRTGTAGITGEVLFDRANNGDSDALGAIRDYCHGLAIPLCNIQCVLDPERFAIGGGISAQPLFLEILQEEVTAAHRYHVPGMPLPHITACSYFNDANLLGAVFNFRSHYGEDET